MAAPDMRPDAPGVVRAALPDHAPPAGGQPVAGPPPSPAAADVLADTYRAYLAADPSPPGGALLAQTVAIGPLRQSFLPLIPLRPGWHVLDVGTGFGAVAFELAHRQPVRVTGIDRDAEVLSVTRQVAVTLADWLRPGSSVELAEAPAEDVPFADATFDLVLATLLLQHVPEPAAVVEEMWRVLRPGGVAFVFDVDDGLGTTYPEGGPLGRLEGAFDAWQASYGGDRRIGRKLSVLFADEGFSILQLLVLPQAQHIETRPGDGTRTMTAARLRAARDGILGTGQLDAATFDALLAEYQASPPRSLCRIESRVALVARKPGGAGMGGSPAR